MNISYYKFNMTQMTNFEKVREFHESFGLPSSSQVNEELLHDFKTVSLRVKLINEEYEELHNSKNIVEQLDAIGDLMYVVYGAGVCFGFDMDNEYHEYFKKQLNIHGLKNTVDAHESNFLKTCYLCDKIDTRNMFRYLGIIDKVSCDPKRIISSDVINFYNLINRLSQELLMCNLNNIKCVLCKMLASLHIIGHLCKFNLDDLFTEIHNSNMTKLCDTELDAQITIDWYKEHLIDRYPEPKYMRAPKSNKYVIYDASTGKRLKSIRYTPPNIIISELIFIY